MNGWGGLYAKYLDYHEIINILCLRFNQLIREGNTSQPYIMIAFRDKHNIGWIWKISCNFCIAVRTNVDLSSARKICKERPVCALT